MGEILTLHDWRERKDYKRVLDQVNDPSPEEFARVKSQIHPEYQYLDSLEYLLNHATSKGDRTGTGTNSTFGTQWRFDLSEKFPLITTKKVHTKGIFHELLWFLRGETNIEFLQNEGVTIWDEWADKEGNLGPVYGAQWRSWPTPDGKFVDQLEQVVDDINKRPDSRRHIVSAWNVPYLANESYSPQENVAQGRMALSPCHALFQFYSEPQDDGTRKLSCQLYQRSADIFLGVPYNIASYGLLNLLVAKLTNHQPGEFIHTFGDLHLYSNHHEQAKEQLAREPKELPRIEVPDIQSLKEATELSYKDFEIKEYDPEPPIKAPIAI